jgi:hypothetical protein
VADLADRLKPVNLIKGLFSQFLGGADTRTTLLRMVAGVATSFLVKKFFKRGIGAKS